jgi:RNA polymerase sigma factor (sigma-70 family)
VETPPDETGLVEEARRGSASAFEALLRMHQTVAFRTAFAITRSAEDAEDVLQTAFLKAHRSLPGFRAGSAFRPWLIAIVANEARNRRRGTIRALRLVDQAGVASAAPSAESVAVDTDERRRLIAAVEGLPAEDRLAVVSRYFVGLSFEETAAVLGVRLGAAKMRVRRALERLRRTLEEGEEAAS